VNVQNYIDQIVGYLQTPAGWIALAAVIGVGFFLLRGNNAR